MSILEAAHGSGAQAAGEANNVVAPAGLVYNAGLPDDVATLRQGVARETAHDFHAKKGRGGL